MFFENCTWLLDSFYFIQVELPACVSLSDDAISDLLREHFHIDGSKDFTAVHPKPAVTKPVAAKAGGRKANGKILSLEEYVSRTLPLLEMEREAEVAQVFIPATSQTRNPQEARCTCAKTLQQFGNQQEERSLEEAMLHWATLKRTKHNSMHIHTLDPTVEALGCRDHLRRGRNIHQISSMARHVAYSGPGEHRAEAPGGGSGARPGSVEPAAEGCGGRSPGAHPPRPRLQQGASYSQISCLYGMQHSMAAGSSFQGAMNRLLSLPISRV